MEIKIGDKVFHKSTPVVIWVVDKIEGNEVFCSTIVKETLEKKEAKFYLTAIEKLKETTSAGIYISKENKKNHY